MRCLARLWLSPPCKQFLPGYARTMYKLFVAIHLIGASIWVGGHLVLCATVLPRALRKRDPSIIQDFESGFEHIGLPALLLQVVSGLWLAYHRLPSVSVWLSLDSTLSWLIAGKLFLLFATVCLALNAQLRVIPRLTADNLHILGWHIFRVTVFAIGFLLIGVGIRTL